MSEIKVKQNCFISVLFQMHNHSISLLLLVHTQFFGYYKKIIHVFWEFTRLIMSAVVLFVWKFTVNILNVRNRLAIIHTEDYATLPLVDVGLETYLQSLNTCVKLCVKIPGCFWEIGKKTYRGYFWLALYMLHSSTHYIQRHI